MLSRRKTKYSSGYVVFKNVKMLYSYTAEVWGKLHASHWGTYLNCSARFMKNILEQKQQEV
jgi:hypothetical protein